MSSKFTVFLDRDGVFNEDPHQVGRWPPQVRKWSQFHWLPGVQEAFARLNRPDIQTCLTTNQPGSAVGLSTPGMIRRLHDRLVEELAAGGGRLDRVEACFAPPGIPYRRRKPRGGMLEDGAKALGNFDKKRAVMVGDKLRDAQAAAAFGVPCILLSTSKTAATLEAESSAKKVPYVAIVPSLAEAVDLILSWAGE